MEQLARHLPAHHLLLGLDSLVLSPSLSFVLAGKQAIANKEFTWCETELKKASRDLGYGDDWHRALEHVKGQDVEPGKQPEPSRELALDAIEYVKNTTTGECRRS